MKRPVRDLTFKEDLIKKLYSGVNAVHSVVAPTMGARGQNVLFWSGPVVRATKDGVTAAIEVFLKDKIEDIGAYLTKEACAKTNKESGDGTTATCVLLRSILKEAIKLSTSGASNILLRKGIEVAAEKTIEFIKSKAMPVEDSQTIKNVARISLNGDAETADIIAQAMEKAGNDGVVTARESNYDKDYLEVAEGMQIKQGYLFQGFADMNTLECNFDKPAILCYEGSIRAVPEVKGIVTALGQAGRPFLILCHECNIDVARFLIHNMSKGLIQCCVVRTPGTGKIRDEILRDFAAYTGSKVLSEYGAELSKAIPTDLGSCEKVIVRRNSSTFYGGKNNPADISERVAKIRKELEEIPDPKVREIYLQRIARLTSSIAIIYVGGKTDIEMQEKKDRVEDALQAVRAAITGGVVPGGGVALLKAGIELTDLAENSDGDFRLGAQIFKKALEGPFRTIIGNAGINPEVIMNGLDAEPHNFFFGFDVNREEFCNMVAKGIIDPAFVLTTAIKNAVSIAGQILSAQAGITEAVDD